MNAKINAKPLVPFGAEITGLDLLAAANDLEPRAYRKLLDEHKLLVFRGLNLSFDQQAKVVGLFGTVTSEKDISEVYVTNVGANASSSELLWHYDLSFCPLPFQGISLHAARVIDGATSTRFASATRAAKHLPEHLRKEVGGLKARHIRHGASSPQSVPAREITFDPKNPYAFHPVLMPHPNTGEEMLTVCELSTDVIADIDPARSSKLLDTLFGYLYDADNVYQHFWNNGDLVVWDNIALHHARANYTQSGPRVLQKVILSEASRRQQFIEHRAALGLDSPEDTLMAARGSTRSV